MDSTVNCAEHGNQGEAFVCSHLAESFKTGGKIGFYYASEARGDAWCEACEQMRIVEGGTSGDWNERSESFAAITLICGGCYDSIKRLNT